VIDMVFIGATFGEFYDFIALYVEFPDLEKILDFYGQPGTRFLF